MILYYDPYCDHCPIQNNGLEGTNSYIKKEGTLRKRLSILQFLNLLMNGFVKRWSTDRKPTVTVERDGVLVEEANVNLKKFNLEPIIRLEDYTTGYQWNKLSKVFTKIRIDSTKFRCVPSSDKITTVTEDFCLEHIAVKSWSSYFEFLCHASKKLKILVMLS